MQFESKMKRTFWTTAALGVIPDVVISMILSAVFDGGILGFFAVLIGLQVLYLLIWAKNALGHGPCFGLVVAKSSRRGFSITFEKMDTPNQVSMKNQRTRIFLQLSITKNCRLPSVLRRRASLVRSSCLNHPLKCSSRSASQWPTRMRWNNSNGHFQQGPANRALNRTAQQRRCSVPGAV